MHPSRLIPESRHPEFERDWLAGMLCRDLGDKYGCSPATASKTAERLGLPPRRAHRGKAWKTRHERDELALTGGQWRPNRRGVQVWHRTEGVSL